MSKLRVITGLGVLVVAAGSGFLVVGGSPVPDALVLTPAGLLGAMVPLLLAPILLKRWQLSVAVLLVWLVVEDLVRKLAGNDIRVYFIKDLIFLLVLVSLVSSTEFRLAWEKATGKQRFALYALLAWALVMSVPTAFDDWRVPLIGLRLDFMYIPLVVAGYLVGRESERLKRWLAGLAALGGLASAVGILQAFLGPQFLSPSEPTPGLGLLVTVRGNLATGSVYRPSGTFVSSGRFASMAIIALALGLAALAIRRRESRSTVLLAVASAMGAVWVSGGRAGFLAGIMLVLAALIAPSFARMRAGLGRATTVAVAGLTIAGLLALFAPSLISSRASWYQSTLDPRSSRNEWTHRLTSLTGSTIEGMELGGLIGRGTGNQSIGLQYIVGGEERSPSGIYVVEGGYATVAVEWGIIGLVLWIYWTVAWTRRQWESIKAVRGTSLAATGLVLFALNIFFLFLGFFGGFQGFQNYFANAYFWLLSGLIFGLPQAVRASSEADRRELAVV